MGLIGHKVQNVTRVVLSVVMSMFLSFMILNLFSLFYSYRGTRFPDETGSTDFKWSPSTFTSNMTEGFAWYFLDTNGYNNAQYDQNRVVDILLMGSSHMEAAQVPQEKNVASVINTSSDLYTYNIGVQGHDFCRCAQNLKSALDTYKPRYVCIETDSVVMDVSEMETLLSDSQMGHLFERDSKIKQRLKLWFPAVTALNKAFHDYCKDSKDMNAIVNSSESTDFEQYKTTLGLLMSNVSETCKNYHSIPIVFYLSKLEFDMDGCITSSPRETKEYIDCFKTACDANDILFIDMTEVFWDKYRSDSILPYGFPNTRIGYGHLNQYGHRMVADEIIKKIEEIE